MDEKLQAQTMMWNSQAIDQILHKVSKVDTLVESVRRQEATLEKLTDAVTKLAVIEDRQNADRADMAEIRHQQKEIRQDVDELKRAEVLNGRVRAAVFALGGIVGTAVIYAILALIGLGK